MKHLLPQGDNIRQLLAKSNITDSNINSLLREKGVFLGRNIKNDSVPLLMKSIISPNDFIELYQTQKTKEENLKYRTSTIKCKKDFELEEIMSLDIDINSLIKENHTYKPNYEVIGSPTFYKKDKNTLILEYTVRRENLLKDWTSNETEHKGSISLKKITDTNIQMSARQNFTSKETFEVNKLLMDSITEDLQKKSLINSKEDIIAVKFDDFSNESRIDFFYSFTSNFNIYIEFQAITDIDLYLDEQVESHKDIKKFIEEIDNLKIKGKGLQHYLLLSKREYFPKLICGSINFKYKLSANRGTIIITLGFPEYIKHKKENAEFEISINILLKKQLKNRKNEEEIRKKLLELFEEKKVKSYDKFKIKSR